MVRTRFLLSNMRAVAADESTGSDVKYRPNGNVPVIKEDVPLCDFSKLIVLIILCEGVCEREDLGSGVG